MIGWLTDNEFCRTIGLMENRLSVYIFSVLGDSVISAFCYNIIMALVLRDLFNAAIGGKKALFVRALTTALVSLLIAIIVQPILRYLIALNNRKTMNSISIKVFEHMRKLPVMYFERLHSGDLIARFTKDIGVMDGIYSTQIPNLVLNLILGIGATIVMIILEWHFAIVIILTGLISIFTNICFSRSMRKASNEIQNNWGKMTESFSDIVSGIQVIKIFGIEKLIFKRYDEKNCNTANAAFKYTITESFLNVVNYCLSSIRIVGLIVAGIYMIMKNTMDIGTLVAIYQLQGNMSAMFSSAGNFTAQIQASLAGAQRVFEFLSEPVEPDKYEMLEDSKCSAMVALENINFSYDHSKRILESINIVVNNGQVAALVGRSGGGKSTIIKLLLGFYPAESGSIYVNQKSLSGYSLNELRELISYVPQDSYLFEGSIEENIQYGRPDASREEVIAAAKIANAHDFIIEQSGGYNTLVGERGAKLSGGQRQRIAIARAALKNAPILVLDEATSSLDSQSEELVQNALNKLMIGRTVIIIAHRLSTIKNANVIYVIDKGSVVESGTHDELKLKMGLYNQFCEMQFSEM